MLNRSLKRRMHLRSVALTRAALRWRAAASRLWLTVRTSLRLMRVWSYLLSLLLDVTKHAAAIAVVAIVGQWWRALQSVLPA